MLKNTSLYSAAIATSLLLCAGLAQGDIAQEPLLNRPKTVAPNLVLILDTSGSMAANYIYQYAGTADGMGMSGPTDKTFAALSPDINVIYYDPRIRYRPRVDYDGTEFTPNAPTASDWKVYFRKNTGVYGDNDFATINDFHSTGTPAGYTPAASLVVAGSTASYPNDVNITTAPKLPATTEFPKFLGRTDCVAKATSCSFTEERQNRSNWNKWYRTRAAMAQTSLGSSFQPIKADTIRLGYATLGQLDGNKLGRGVASYSEAAGGTKENFFDWLYGHTFNTATPNLKAVDNVGKYYSRTDNAGPWSSTPDPASTGITTVAGTSKTDSDAHASCRRSFAMLVTDGYSNGTIPKTAGNRDKTTFEVGPTEKPDYKYKPVDPFQDDYDNTMADLAMLYWGTDLRPDLANRVPKISNATTNNISTWQNMSFYGVTLGIVGTLNQTKATLDGMRANPKTATWPKPESDKPTSIDDLWHATVNGRGEMLNAKNSAELTLGVNKMIETIAGTPQTLSGVAVSTTFLKNGTRKYKPEYIPGTWSGRLSAIELNATTGNDAVPANVYWQVENGVDVNEDPISLITSASSRSVLTWSGTAGAAFNAKVTGLSDTLVQYIKGDPTNEIRKPGGTYRTRTAILGDIVNSSPVYVLDNVDLNYEKLGFTNYRSFIATKAARPNGVLFVGANDGMLHGFQDSNGAEVFAYVPKAVWPKLSKLAEIPYSHQYYVDGPNVETDAYLDGNWMNVLLGTTGAGAKAVYALNVTSPTSMDSSSILWEVSSATSGFSNLGNVLSDVQAGKVAATPVSANDDWVAVFGNGFDSTSGVASLFVVNLRTGALLKEIVADNTGSNGLGGVRIVRNENQQIIGAYAGDLKGNLWKFDLTGTDRSFWKVGLGGAPLFKAGTSRSITATPAIIPHPSGGYVVNVGTGRFFDIQDALTTSTITYARQRLYGIWDKQPFGATTTPTGAAFDGETALQVQTISPVTVGTTTYYKISANPVDWGDGLSTKKRGWYIELANDRQRVAYPIERLSMVSGQTFVLASTISPVSASSEDLCVQTGSGSGWTYLVDGLTGSGATIPALDTNGDGVVNNLDVVVSGYQDPLDGRPTTITIGSSGGGTGCIVTAQNTCVRYTLKCGQVGMPACPPPTNLNVKHREWRQLFMR